MAGLLDKARALLQGEPLRLIGYGAGFVIYFVSWASGSIDDIPFETAVTLAIAGAGTLATIIETARRFVYSPASVAQITAQVATAPPTAAGPLAAAAEVAAKVEAGESLKE